ncbi:hypothetical protein [Larkinella rosea]|uniref:Outer membrane protein beta-barrel domain-containing protein n=1 Tax=Larkinella rosea TaxID=2025312 RepID=A0A3P1BE96_9BACT|nr:hypothetical protein [Larkinella rosea]RRA99172.1 hypothetical protein EHT25_29845 [Larkinella rosea]
MKKTIYCSALFVILAVAPGFSQIDRKITVMLNMGLGVQSYSVGGLCNGASFELGFTDKISAGGYFDYALTGTKFGDHRWKAQFVNYGVRGSYHLASALGIGSNKFDPYAGLSVGTRTVIRRERLDQNPYSKLHARGFFPGVHMGGFYHFSQKIGGFAELGWGIAILRMGITGKF